MITPRQKDILNGIIELFARSHEPVGSKALQEMIASSSATIRNDMAKLEQLGLLEKAHTSSGRLPSRAGFQYFVTHLLNLEQMDEEDVYRVVKAFDFEAFKLEDILERASSILADLTGYTSVILDVEPTAQVLTSFSLVGLSSHDALAVLTLDQSKSVTVQFAIPRSFSGRDLAVLQQLVEERLVDQTVLSIHYKLRTEVPQIVQRYFRTTDNVLDLMDYIFSKLFQESVFIGGKVVSLDFGRLSTYQLLDKPQLLASQLRRGMSEEQVTKVVVGEHEDPALADVTLIHHRFPVPYRGMGQMTLIGPVQMDYRRQISRINIVSRVLFMKLTDYYRYLSSNHYEVH